MEVYSKEGNQGTENFGDLHYALETCPVTNKVKTNVQIWHHTKNKSVAWQYCSDFKVIFKIAKKR